MPTFPPPTLTSKWSSSKHFVKPLLGKYCWNPGRGPLGVCAVWHAGIRTVVIGCPWSLFPQVPFIVCPAPKFYSSFKIQLQCCLYISQQKLNPLPLLHFACMVLYTYFVLLGIPAVIQFCAPTSKKRFFGSGLLSLSSPKPSGPGWHIALYRAGQ